ncbi:hypothetical protein CASFOL_029651 [Castilleja foliolosa]|uniref:C2H2-type domain-containing protein n=1 Tax=Castilleja foliolosa TaxID=1961234 RepID=A0ABD3CBL3_9LAMI
MASLISLTLPVKQTSSNGKVGHSALSVGGLTSNGPVSLAGLGGGSGGLGFRSRYGGLGIRGISASGPMGFRSRYGAMDLAIRGISASGPMGANICLPPQNRPNPPDLPPTHPRIRKLNPRRAKTRKASPTHPINRKFFPCPVCPRSFESAQARYNHGVNEHPKEIRQKKYKEGFKILQKNVEDALRGSLYQESMKKRFEAAKKKKKEEEEAVKKKKEEDEVAKKKEHTERLSASGIGPLPEPPVKHPKKTELKNKTKREARTQRRNARKEKRKARKQLREARKGNNKK